jgi:hypothetical protein
MLSPPLRKKSVKFETYTLLEVLMGGGGVKSKLLLEERYECKKVRVHYHISKLIFRDTVYLGV